MPLPTILGNTSTVKSQKKVGGMPTILEDTQKVTPEIESETPSEVSSVDTAMAQMNQITNPEVVNEEPVKFPTYEAKKPQKAYGEDRIKRATENLKKTTDYSKVGSFERYAKEIGGGFIQGILQTPKAIDDLVDLVKGQELNTGGWTDRLARTGEMVNENIMAQVSADPTFADQLSGGIGSMGSFLIPSTGAGKLAGATTKVVQLFKGSEKVAEWVAKLTAQTSMTALESSMESGSVYDDVYEKTGSEKEAIKMAESTAVSNAVLLGVTNKFSGYFEALPSGAKNAVKRVLSAFFSEGSQESGQSVISNLATGEEWSKGVKDSFLIGGIIGSGATLATANVFDSNGKLDIKKVQEVIDKTKETKAKIIQAQQDGISQEEIINSIADKNGITPTEAQTVVENVMKTVDTPMTEKDFTEQQDALVEDIKGAIDSGSRISAITNAIVDQYGVSPEYAGTLVQRAITEKVSPVPTEEIAQVEEPAVDIAKVKEKITNLTKDIPKLKQGSVEKKNAKIELETERAKLRTIKQQEKSPVVPTILEPVTDKVDIKGNEVFIGETKIATLQTEKGKDGNVTIHEIETTAGGSKKGNGTKIISKLFETAKTLDGTATKKSVGFWEKMGASFVGNADENGDIEFTLKKEDFNNKKGVNTTIDKPTPKEQNKTNDKTIQRTIRAKRRKVSKPVSNGETAGGEAGKASSGTSEEVIQGGQPNTDTTKLGSDTDGTRPTIKVSVLINDSKNKDSKSDLIINIDGSITLDGEVIADNAGTITKQDVINIEDNLSDKGASFSWSETDDSNPDSDVYKDIADRIRKAYNEIKQENDKAFLENYNKVFGTLGEININANPQAETDFNTNVEPTITSIDNEVTALKEELATAPDANKADVQEAIDLAEETKAGVENTFLDKYEAKEITNEQITETIAGVISIDDVTGEVTVGQYATTEDITNAIAQAKLYKSGGTTKEGRGILDEYYTDKKIVNAVFSILDIPDNTTVLEPSVGVGNFVPTNVSTVDGYEINATTAGIAKLLNPKMTVFNKSFETNFVDEKGNKKTFEEKYNLVVGNPPYGEHRGLYKGLGEEQSIGKYEDYFTKRGLDVVKTGGKVVFVIPSSFLKTQTSKSKEAIAKLGKVEVAFRLPENAFDGTSIGTDIVVFTKEPTDTRTELDARLGLMNGDNYFQYFPDNVLGETLERKNRFGKLENYVEGTLDDALAKLNALNIEKIAITVAKESGVEATPENIDTIKEVIAESETNDVTELVKEAEKENTEAVKKEKAKTKKIIDKIRKVAPKSTAKQVNLRDVQETTFTEEEVQHWENRNQDGSIKSDFTHNPAITSYSNGKWYMDFTYLQGNVYEKLAQLEKDKSHIDNKQYDRQKKALESVKPEKMPLERIKINANSPFLKDFLVENKGTSKTFMGRDDSIEVSDDVTLASSFMDFVREVPSKARGGMSISDISGYVRQSSVVGGSKDENARIRKYRAIVANELLEKYFADLRENNKELAQRIEDEYNERYNATHIPNYLNVPLTITINNSLNGSPFQITSVQQQGVGRLVEKGVGILAHDVGFGKTLTAILATYQNIKNGHTKKPLFIVPKATYNQWVNTILEVIPDAKVNNLYNLADQYKGDLSSLTINEGEFNIVTEEGFKQLSFKDETYSKYASDYAYITDDLNSSKTTRQSEKEREQMGETKGKMKRGTRSDLYFEDLGFDHIVVDEVHNANNIITKIKMPKDKATEFRSISKPANPSQYGVKTWLASQYIQDNNNGKNVYLLSATPFTNSPLQYFSVLSLLANKTMKSMGVDNINDFLTQFMDTEVRLEYKANGTFSEKQVVRNFKNNNLLRKLLGEFIDFKDGEDNPDLIRPDKRQQVNNFSKSDDYAQKELEIQSEFASSKDTLKLIGQLRALSISSTLLKGDKPNIADYKSIVENSPKLYAIARTIGNNQKLNKKAGREATEIVYSPLGVEIFPILKEYLIKEQGMKPEEISVITGDVKAEKRSEIQAEFNKEGGAIKVLMGTDTIGTGMNLQKRTSDIHFLGLPYNFTDLIQVEGRGWRQGNKWRNIRMNHYLMENSYDALHFQILTSKQKRYELAIKNNDDTIDVGDVDVEKQLSELITDPNLIADIRLQEDKKKIAEELRTKSAELSYAQKKVDKIVDIEKELMATESSLSRAKSQLEDKDTSAYMKEYYAEQIAKDEKEIKTLKADIAKQRQAYIDNGIDIKAIYALIDPLKLETTQLSERLSAIDTLPSKQKYLDDAKKSIKPVVPFELTDVQSVIDAYTDENKSFYELESRHLDPVEEPIKETIVESPVPVEVAPKSKSKTVSAKNNPKTPRITKKSTSAVAPELAIINDKSLTVNQKVDTLLNKKQEGKEYKDVGERVSGSKKEKATIKAIYKYGGQEMFDEIVKQLGWEAVLETVDKAEILAETNAENTIQSDYDNKVPAPLAQVKKDLIDSIYKVPKLAGKKKGKWNYDHYTFVLKKDSYRTNAEKEDLIAVAKVYPNTLKQLVNHILSIKDSMPELIADDIYIDALGNIVKEEDAKYRIEKEAFGFSDTWGKRPKNLIERASQAMYLGDGKYGDAVFRAEDYEKLLNPAVKEKRTSDDQHGNFDAIDKYDIGDAEVPKDKVKAETLTTDYGFKSVQLGNYMDDESSYEHIQQTIGALDSMTKALGIDFAQVIAKRGLSIAYGARGGGKALAHYEPSANIINMTKKRGDGSFGHEFMHFLDFTTKTSKGGRVSSLYVAGHRYYTSDSAGRELMKALLSGGYDTTKVFSPNDKSLDEVMYFYSDSTAKEFNINKGDVASFILKEYAKDPNLTGKRVTIDSSNGELAFNNYGGATLVKIDGQLLANLTGKDINGTVKADKSVFYELSKKNLGGGKDSYWTKKEELLARAFEAYLYDKLEVTGNKNAYAVRDNVAQTDTGFLAWAYPQGDERVAINKLFDNLFTELRNTAPYYTAEQKKEVADKKAQIEQLQIDKIKLAETMNNDWQKNRTKSIEIYDKLDEKFNDYLGTAQEDRTDAQREEYNQAKIDAKKQLESSAEGVAYKKSSDAYQAVQDKIQELENGIKNIARVSFKYKGEVSDSVKTVSGEFLKDASKRLKVDFDYNFYDVILGQQGRPAWGVTLGTSIAMEKTAPFITERHEFVHFTLRNLKKIEALKHLNRYDILMEQTKKMGLPIEMYQSYQVEEALAQGIETYEKGEMKLKSDSKIKQLYDYLILQFGKMLRAIGLSNGNIINEYYDILLYGQSTEDAYVDLSNGREFTKYINENVLDLSTSPEDFELSDEYPMMKEKINKAKAEYNKLVEEIKQNQEIMSVVSRYTDKATLNDIVETANNQVSQYVKAILEIENIKKDVDDASVLFARLVKNRENIEDLQQALESKLTVITTKVHNTGKRTKTSTVTVVADAVANETNENAGDAGEDVPFPVTPEALVEKMIPTKPLKDGKKVSTFQHRMLGLLEEQNRHDVQYNVMHKIAEVAKAEAYYDANKKRVTDMALGKEPFPADVSGNVITLTVLQKAKEAGDNRTIARVLPKLSLRATAQGQEIAMLANAFGERDPISYMNRLIAQRKLLAKKKYKPFFSSLNDAKGFEDIVKEKVKIARKKASKLSDLMQLKAQDIDNFLDDITC